MRIYIDESGTHGGRWLIIGMLFVPEHGAFHSELCRIKSAESFFNASPKHAARFGEIHFKNLKSRGAVVAERWIDAFLASSAYFRSIVIEWDIWEGKHFGTPFESDGLKKQRAYKKWAELLLAVEVRNFRQAKLFLDRFNPCAGYDVLEQLKERFTRNYEGDDPWISEFTPSDSRGDAMQCLQLCDLLVGCVHQSLVPCTKKPKQHTASYLFEKLRALGVSGAGPSFWKGFAKNCLGQRFPKFSEWFWTPTD